MSGLYIDPLVDTSSYDTVVFNDSLYTPGKCKVTGWNREVEYDHKKGKGTAGAEQTLKGLPPAKGSIEFETWNADQRAQWNAILDAIMFDPTKVNANASSTTSTSGSTSTTSSTSSSTASTTTGSSGVPSTGQSTSSFTGNTPNASTSSSSTASQPSPLSSNFAIAIYYPTLADINVHFVLPPEKLGIWEPVGDDFSHMKRTVEFVEYTGQPPNTSVATTPTGATDPSTTPASPGSQASAGAPGEGPAATNSATNSGSAATGAQSSWMSSS